MKTVTFKQFLMERMKDTTQSRDNTTTSTETRVIATKEKLMSGKSKKFNRF